MVDDAVNGGRRGHWVIPALADGPQSENIHGFDERVNLDSLCRVTQTIALFVAEWCGLEAIEDNPDNV